MKAQKPHSKLDKLKDIIAKWGEAHIPFYVISFIVVVAILAFGVVPEHASWEIGKVATQDLIADRSVSFEDTQATQALQAEALQGFEEPITIDLQEFNRTTLATFDKRYDALLAILFPAGEEGEEGAEGEADAALPETAPDAQRQALAEQLKITLSDDQWTRLQNTDKDRLDMLHAHVVGMMSDVASLGVSSDDVAQAENTIRNRIMEFSSFSDSEKVIFLALLDGVVMVPTAKVDQRQADIQKNAILQEVDPVHHTIQKGQLIVSRGDVITPTQYDAIRALDYTSDGSRITVILGLVILVFLVYFLIHVYLRHFLLTYNAPKWRQWYIIILTVILLAVLSFPVVTAISITANEDIASQVGFMIPIPAAAMLIGVLIGGRVAVLTLLMLSVLLGVYTGNVYFLFAAVAGGMVGIVQTKRVARRGDLNYATLYISLAVSLVVIAHGLITGLSVREILLGLVFALGNGFLSVVLTIGVLPFLESAFRVTTSLTLLELADPSMPLLRRLSEEAPGTYHHSILVANLAENAALAIEADSLLVRTAAYYHDVGKLKRPAFFSENQMSGENPHDKIGPSLSTLIITAHVKDGVAMAKEAKIPETIIDLMAQHHGDTTVAYFYNKAKEEDEDIPEENFRYHQRKPQTREAAILMMADTVEAAVRSQAGKLTAGEMSGFIRQLIDQKQADGQFEECDLTFRDLRKIGDAFTKIMTGVYHKRIEYPDQKQLRKQLEG